MSKELEALKRIRQETCPATYMDDFDKNECCDVIEQALLKTQEPKHYLKWEDLEFSYPTKIINVKIEENKYTLDVGFNVTLHKLVILRNKTQEYFFLEDDKQFFNDLHLERLEE